MKGEVSARAMNRALYAHFAERYAVVTEVEATEHEPTAGRPFVSHRRCDVLLLSRKERLAVEVKVSRADYLQDVRAPEKQACWTRLTHRQAYAVPAGLVTLDEVPAGFGLLTVTFDTSGRAGAVTWALRAPKRPGHVPASLPERLEYGLLRRLAFAEAAQKGHGWGLGRDDDVGTLRAKVARLERDVEVARNRTYAADDRAREWHRRFSTVQPPACDTCGRPLSPGHGRLSLSGWKHSGADEAVCQPLREAAENARIDALDDSERQWMSRHRHVPGPCPVDLLIATDCLDREPSA